MDDTSFPCVDPDVPLAITGLADDRAIAVRPDNGGGNSEAAGEHLRFWWPGMILRVRFLDTPEFAPRVLAAAAAWSEHANLEFQLVADGPAEIRVTCEGTTNWSALGTDSLVPELYAPEEPTMCLAELPVASSSKRVLHIVRHEFGHAIGLIHEHASPAAGIAWDKQAVYAALGAEPNGWPTSLVDTNIFHTYSRTTTNHSAFDPESIMLWAFPPQWTLDRLTFRENIELSATDADFVGRIYPRQVSDRR